MVLSIIPASQASIIKLIKLGELSQFMDSEQIPNVLGGVSKIKHQIVPNNSRSVKEFEPVSDSSATKLKKHVDSNSDPKDFEIASYLPVIQ